MFDIISQLDALNGPALTIRAQALSELDPPDVELTWRGIAPRRDVDSVFLGEIFEVDHRPVAERREWDARGKFIPVKSPRILQWSMLPISSYFHLSEYEMQRMLEQHRDNQERFLLAARARVTDRADTHAIAANLRVEVDFYNAWLNNQVDVMNPTDGSRRTVAINLNGARYPTEDWLNNNAWEAFVNAAKDARNLVGPLAGCVMRTATLEKIQQDAPQPLAVRLTMTELEQRIQQELGTGFTIREDERTVDIFDDTGVSTTRTNIFTAQKVAFVPRSNNSQIGWTYFTPNVLAMDLDPNIPDNTFDLRGARINPIPVNDSKGIM
jgi:hypothetical protein